VSDALTGDAIAVSLRAAGCVFADEEAAVLQGSAASDEELLAMVRRRVSGEPIEQIVRWAEFCGQRVEVEPGVFVPRRRTEFLVRQAASLARCISGHARPLAALDLCCGTGAIGMALADQLPPFDLYAADIDPVAVACARRNLDGLGRVFRTDLFRGLPNKLRGRIDLVVSCAPYVPDAHLRVLPAESRDFEPKTALAGGDEGLDVVGRILTAAPAWLRPGGYVAVELSVGQVEDAGHLAQDAGLNTRLAWDDDFEAVVLIGSTA
jgi:release factor glutamine methyltransferase